MTKSYWISDIGCVRTHNEDSCLSLPEKQLYAVADGMGGQAAGEVASSLLVEVLREDLSSLDRIGEEELRRAVLHATERILQEAEANPQKKGMGTTATVLKILDGRALWAHVGDSRLYLYRGGHLQQVTCDHSYVESLVSQGSLTEEEARKHPQRNMLLRAVGVERGLEVDTGSFPLQWGDFLLLATDGLMNMVEDAAIAEVLEAARQTPERCEVLARELVQMALNAGGTDNVTVVAVVYS